MSCPVGSLCKVYSSVNSWWWRRGGDLQPEGWSSSSDLLVLGSGFCKSFQDPWNPEVLTALSLSPASTGKNLQVSKYPLHLPVLFQAHCPGDPLVNNPGGAGQVAQTAFLHEKGLQSQF
jgi:hypothetical protein